jgi:hypothetical protein
MTAPETNDNGQTFSQFMRAVDRVYVETIGLGADDLGDAPWYDYFRDGLDAVEAAACAMADYQDVPDDIMEFSGLTEYI